MSDFYFTCYTLHGHLRQPTRTFLLVIVLSAINLIAPAQSVSGIITDYGGYWKSSASSMNPVKPDNSHTLLAFTYNGVQYSTGANDALLSSHGQTFQAQDFWSLPIENVTGKINGNTKIGYGAMKDGVYNGSGPGAPTSNDLAQYLTDGTKGLDLGTCVANLPKGDLTFFVNNIDPSHIGDGIPDILVTQIADPSGSTDNYEFLDENNLPVGIPRSISLYGISPVGNWTADFYEASETPLRLTNGYTQTDRPIRLWAADLSYFGITSLNYANIRSFVIHLSGNSDVAFVSYNRSTIGIGSILPVNFSGFKTSLNQNVVTLNWSTASENGSASFSIERSQNGRDFTEISRTAAAGESNSAKTYVYTDKLSNTGTYYYRIRENAVDSRKTYSATNKIIYQAGESGLSVAPNPAVDNIKIGYISTDEEQTITVRNLSGHLIYSAKLPAGSNQTELNLAKFPSGNYSIVINNGQQRYATLLVKQ